VAPLANADDEEGIDVEDIDEEKDQVVAQPMPTTCNTTL